MTFPGKPHEETPPRRLRKFAYRTYPDATEQTIQAHEIYFYDHGRIGFWNDTADGERTLILGTKAFQVREVTNE
jgi:hypothetical protein